MRFGWMIVFTVLSIFSFGLGSAFSATIETPPISATTELPLYENGDRIVINGNIRDYNHDVDSGKGLTLIIKDKDNNIVAIGQLIPSSDGSFSYSKIVAGGKLWKNPGDYTIDFHFGSVKGTSKIVYTGGEFTPPPPEQPSCTPNQDLIDGKCVDKVRPPKDDITPPPPPPPPPSDEEPIKCGKGTELVNGVCKPIEPEDKPKSGGCLIATAAFGTELAPQVQFLREIRDNTVLTTSSGTAFMTGFNQLYYSFSPTIADLEREHPLFQDAVRSFITPMIYSLSIMTLADGNSEIEVLGLGLSVIALNLGMYIVAPTVFGFKVHKYLKSKK